MIKFTDSDRQEIRRMTRQKYGWICDYSPSGSPSPKSNWVTPYHLRRRFTKVNYLFTKDGTRIRVI